MSEKVTAKFEKHLAAETFARVALLLSGLWFLLALPLGTWFFPKLLWREVRPAEIPCDFVQYYAGATAARHNLWDALYPIPKTTVYNQPPVFTPIYKTALFKPFSNHSKKYYFPSISFPEASDIDPRLLALSPELDESFRYMYPPPLALLLQPLASFNFETAAHRIWPLFEMASLFGISFFASQIHRLLRNGPSYAEGWIVLAIVCFSLRGRTCLVDGNVSPVIGFLITFATYGWMRGWQLGVGVAMIPMLLFKGMGLSWCPLLLLRRIRWNTILTLAFIALLANGVTLFFAGTSVYRHYFFDILPKLAPPVGEGMVPMIFHTFGLYPRYFYSALNATICIILYRGYWKGLAQQNTTARHATVAATLAGSMSSFCLLNFSVWPHYIPAYIYCPFLGWIVWEETQAQGVWKWIIFCGITLGLGIVAFEWLGYSLFFHMAGAKGVFLYRNYLFPAGLFFFIPLFFLTIALYRLLIRCPQHQSNTLAAPAAPTNT